MKLKEIAVEIGPEFRGDGEVDIFMPAPIEAAGPGTIIFVASEKYAPHAGNHDRIMRHRSREFAARAKCSGTHQRQSLLRFRARAGTFFSSAHGHAPGIDPSRAHRPRCNRRRERVDRRARRYRRRRRDRQERVHPSACRRSIRASPSAMTSPLTATSSIREGVSIGNRVTILSGAVIGADGFGFVRARRRPVQNSASRHGDD